MVDADRRPSQVHTLGSFRNAIVALAAIGGSTNAVVHLLAIAGRLGIALTLDDFDRVGARVPLLVDLQPAGAHLMEDFHRAGGLLAVLREVARPARSGAIDRDRPAVGRVSGRRPQIWDPRSSGRAPSRSRRRPGSRCCAATSRPAGAVIKPAAASPELLHHRGRALVFDSIEDLHARAWTTPIWTSTRTRSWCCAAAVRRATRACPRSPTCRCPRELLEQGVRDMVRICDGRMSGTAYGTVVLHVAPEAAAGGPLAWCARATGSCSTLTSAESTSSCRMASWRPRAVAGLPTPYAHPTRGWERLYIDHVLGADTGADLDFLVGSSGSEVGRESH